MNEKSEKRAALERAAAQLNSIEAPLNDVAVVIDAWCDRDEIAEAMKLLEDMDRLSHKVWAFLRDRLDET